MNVMANHASPVENNVNDPDPVNTIIDSGQKLFVETVDASSSESSSPSSSQSDNSQSISPSAPFKSLDQAILDSAIDRVDVLVTRDYLESDGSHEQGTHGSERSSTAVPRRPSYLNREGSIGSFEDSENSDQMRITFRDVRSNSMSESYMLTETYPDLTYSRPLLSVERRNDRSGRALRVTQRELKVVGGNKIQTRIEVFDTLITDCPVIFSVKHTHGNLWGRQMIVHKNLLVACILAEIAVPPMEIPKDSVKMFRNTENVSHMHSYMERVLPHVRFPQQAEQKVRLYWWRAVDNGATVLHNELTGRLIIIKNKEKKLPGAAETILTAIGVLRKLALAGEEEVRHMKQQGTAFDEHSTQDGSQKSFPSRITSSTGMGSSIGQGNNRVNLTFNDPDPLYPKDKTSNLDIEGDDRRLSVEEIKDHVQKWAVDKKVSPWMTSMIIKAQGTRKGQVINIRYSLDTDLQDPMALSIQVHSNEPLSRELQAFPICMIPVTLNSTRLRDVRLTFLQALWFLRKLYDFHQESEGSGSGGSLVKQRSPGVGITPKKSVIPSRCPSPVSRQTSNNQGSSTGQAYWRQSPAAPTRGRFSSNQFSIDSSATREELVEIPPYDPVVEAPANTRPLKKSISKNHRLPPTPGKRTITKKERDPSETPPTPQRVDDGSPRVLPMTIAPLSPKDAMQAGGGQSRSQTPMKSSATRVKHRSKGYRHSSTSGSLRDDTSKESFSSSSKVKVATSGANGLPSAVLNSPSTTPRPKTVGS